MDVVAAVGVLSVRERSNAEYAIGILIVESEHSSHKGLIYGRSLKDTVGAVGILYV